MVAYIPILVPLVESIHRVHQDTGNIRWVHCLREANQVAYKFAKHSLSTNSSLRIFNVMPSFISDALLADVSSVSFPITF